MDEEGERIPLTICDFDRQSRNDHDRIPDRGSFYREDEQPSRLEMHFHDFVGPLGNPSEFVHEDVEETEKEEDTSS